MPRQIEAVQPVQGGNYIDGDERDGYVDRPMKLLGIQRQGQSKFGPRWVIEAVMLDSAEKVLIALAANATRDVMFGQVRDDLDADPFWTFRTATDDELETAAEALALVDETSEPVGSDDPGELDEAATAASKRGKGK
jgi:hypothetical protein